MSRFDIIDPVTPSASHSVDAILGNLNAEADRNVQLAQTAAQAQIAKAQIDAQQTMQKAGIEADAARQESGQAFQEQQLQVQLQAEQEQQAAALAAQEEIEGQRRKQVDDQFAIVQKEKERERQDNLEIQSALLQGRIESVPEAKKKAAETAKRVREATAKGNALTFLLDSETSLSGEMGGKLLEDAESAAQAQELVHLAITTDVKESVAKTLETAVLDKTDGGKYEVVDPKLASTVSGRFTEATRLLQSTVDRMTDKALGSNAEEKKGLIKEYISAVMSAAYYSPESNMEGLKESGVTKEGAIGARIVHDTKAQQLLAKLIGNNGIMSASELDVVLRSLDDAYTENETAARQGAAGKVQEKAGDLGRKDRKAVDTGKTLASVYQYAGNIRSFAASAGFSTDVGKPQDVVDAIDTAAVTYSMLASPEQFREWALKTMGPKARDPKLLARWERRREEAVKRMQSNRASRGVSLDEDLLKAKEANDSTIDDLFSTQENVMADLSAAEAQRQLDAINKIRSR